MRKEIYTDAGVTWFNSKGKGLYRNVLTINPNDYSDTKSDYKESKELFISVMMKKYNITEEDLHDINTVKTKLRDINIDEILK